MNPRLREVTRLWVLAQPTVSAFITTMVRDFRDRDDVLQNVAVAVFEGFDRYDADRPFVPWAIGVARNQVRLYLRRRARDRHTFDNDALDRVAAAFGRVVEADHDQLAQLGECLQAIKGRVREICDLRYREDLKPAAIAARMGMQANAVSKVLQRARDQLRQCLERRAVAGGPTVAQGRLT